MKLEEPVAGEVRRFLELARARGLTRHTVRHYELALKELLASAARRGRRDLRDLEPRDFVVYLNELVEKGREEATVRGRLYALQHLFRFLHASGVLLVDPTVRLHRRYVPENMRAWLSEDEVLKLLDAPRLDLRCDEVKNRAILEVLYSTGLRLGELARLEVNDVDFSEGFVTVRTSKNGEGRVVPIGREALRWVRLYLQEARPLWVDRNRDGRDATPLLFLTRQGKPLRPNEVNVPLERYAARAGIEKRVTSHVLRHSFAMHLLKNGASSRHVQALLGHRQLLATQRYTRLMPQGLKDAHDRAHPRRRLRTKVDRARRQGSPPQT